MAYILHLDTTSATCSVAISLDGKCIAHYSAAEANKQSDMLSIYITELTNEAKTSMSDLRAIALSDGPGSYTGMRIGASVAKGLCYGLGIPLISIPTLQSMAWYMRLINAKKDTVYIPMIEARNGNVYTAVYDINLRLIKNTSLECVDQHLLDEYLRTYKNIKVGGSGAFNIIKLGNIQFGTVIDKVICDSKNMVELSYAKYQQAQFEDITYYEPFYLKEFEARSKK